MFYSSLVKNKNTKMIRNVHELNFLHTAILTAAPTRRLLLPLLGVYLLSCAGHGMAQEDGDHTYTSEAIEKGSRIYVQQCSLCHGVGGDRVDGINLSIGKFKTVIADDDIKRVISGGQGEGRMPAFDMKSVQLNNIVAYLRAGFHPSNVNFRLGNAEQGKLLFNGKGNCSDCHRIHGSGPRTAPDLSEIGLTLTPGALQRSILEPDGSLLPINRAVNIIMLDEEIVVGRRLNEDTYSVQLIDSNEQLRSLLKTDIAVYELSVTATHKPNSLNDNEVADLVGYLSSLRGQR